MHMTDRLLRSIAGFIALAILATPACQRGPAPAQGQRPPDAPAGALSDYSPAQPYRQLAQGILAQTVYVAEADGPFTAELWDLIVGPGMRSEAAVLPGAAIFEIRSGTGTVSVGGQGRDARMGMTFSIPEGEQFTVVNGSPDQALMIRATVVRARE